MVVGAWRLLLPADFAEYLSDSKGYFGGAELVCDDKRFMLDFYEPVRLAQTIADEIASVGYFFEKNVVVVPSVTHAEMLNALRKLLRADGHLDLVPETNSNSVT